jgi:hypothetical protein
MHRRLLEYLSKQEKNTVPLFIVRFVSLLINYIEKTMIVYGGYIDNGAIIDEMVSLDLDYFIWSNVSPKNPIESFA